MKSIFALALAVSFAAASPLSLAADSTQHDEHHPDAPAAKAASRKQLKVTGTLKASAEQMGKMDAQMKAMRDMHEKMMAAKTSEEHHALMAEQMRTMQDGMPMMNGMMAGNSTNAQPMSPEMMQKQMEMMQVMMQMMMDRMRLQTPVK